MCKPKRNLKETYARIKKAYGGDSPAFTPAVIAAAVLLPLAVLSVSFTAKTYLTRAGKNSKNSIVIKHVKFATPANHKN
jgi:hypothetical protein